MLNCSQFDVCVLATLQQYRYPDKHMTIFPSISVGMMLPHDSPVFQLVERGDVLGLKKLIGQGKASLRDRDPDGASLLFVST